MLPVFLDAKNEIGRLAAELDQMNRKLTRYYLVHDPEDKDSHVASIAGCIAGIYNGVEKVLVLLIKYFDGEIPADPKSWHADLLIRAKNENEGVRPPVISEETYNTLDELRGFRHVYRSHYHTNLIPSRIFQRAEDVKKVIPTFLEEFRTFQETMESLEGPSSH
jgi:hypothetical protein